MFHIKLAFSDDNIQHLAVALLRHTLANAADTAALNCLVEPLLLLVKGEHYSRALLSFTAEFVTTYLSLFTECPLLLGLDLN